MIPKILFVWGIILLDPFGLNSATSRQSEAIFTRLFAPFYDRSGQDRITSVVITDDAAERIAGTYPLPFADHARIVRRILCLDPAAVFIDLNFRHIRGDENGLAQFVDALSHRSGPEGCDRLPVDRLSDPTTAPVLLAVVKNTNSSCPSLLDGDHEGCSFMSPLRALLTVTTPIDVTGMIENDRYRLVWTSASGGEVLSPAASLVATLCNQQRVTAPACGLDTKDIAKPMLVRWGYYLSPLTASRFGNLDPCETTSGDGLAVSQKWKSLGAILLRDLTWAFSGSASREQPTQPCLYTDAVEADHFLRPDVNSDPVLRALVKDRIIVYGADITALPDQVVSPVHGKVPGLFIHAMAADNLLTLGTQYWRDPPKIFFWDLSTVIELIFMAVLIVSVSLLRPHGCGAKRLFAIVFPVALLSVAFALTAVCAIAPLNCVLAICTQLVVAIAEYGPDDARIATKR